MDLMHSNEMKMYEHVLEALHSTVKSNQKAKFKLLDLIDNIFTDDIDYSSFNLTNFENYSVNFKNVLQSPTDIYLYGLQIESVQTDSVTSGKLTLGQFTSRDTKRIMITADIGDDKRKKITVPVGCFGAKFSIHSIFIRTGCNESPYNSFYFEVSIKGKTCCGKTSHNMSLQFKDQSSITFRNRFRLYQTKLADPIECFTREFELDSPVLSQMKLAQNTSKGVVVLASHGEYSFNEKRQVFVPSRTEVSIEPNTITIMLNELSFSVTQISYENGRLGVTVVRDGFSLRVENAGPKSTFTIRGKEVSFNACKALFNLPDIGVSLLEANFFGEFTVTGKLEDFFSLKMKYVSQIVIKTKDLLHSAFVYQELKVDWKREDARPNLKFDRFALKFDNLLFHFTNTENISNYSSKDSTIASLTTNPTRPSLELKEFLHMFQLRSQSLHLLHGHFYIHSLKSISLDIPRLSFTFMADLFSEAYPKSEIRATAIFQIQIYSKSSTFDATVDLCFKNNTYRKLCLSTDQIKEFLLLASIYSHYSDIEIHSTLVSTRNE